MMEKVKMERGVVELVDTERLVSQEHLLRKVDKAVDFRKLYETGRSMGRSPSMMMTIRPSPLERSGTTPQKRSWRGGTRQRSKR